MSFKANGAQSTLANGKVREGDTVAARKNASNPKLIATKGLQEKFDATLTNFSAQEEIKLASYIISKYQPDDAGPVEIRNPFQADAASGIYLPAGAPYSLKRVETDINTANLSFPQLEPADLAEILEYARSLNSQSSQG